MKRLSRKQKLYRKLKKQYKSYLRRYKKFLRRFRKFSKAYKKSLQANSHIIILLLIVGFILCIRVIVSSLPQKTVTTKLITISQPITKKQTASGPAQDNSLFATYPSWSQDFSAPKAKISSKYWNVYNGPAPNSNNEAEYYSPKNVSINNGSLDIEATRSSEPDGYQYGSGRLDTQNKESFLYGRIDITATLPNGVGTWPAIWLLPANNYYEDQSPSSDYNRYLNGGELDIVEEVGFQPNVNYGIVHTLNSALENNGIGVYNTISLPGNNATYNTYTLIWTPTTIAFEVNNQPYFTYDKPADSSYVSWPFDQPFYLIMNLAIGGSWGGEDTSQFPLGIDNSIFPTSMNIKSIYYYPYVG